MRLTEWLELMLAEIARKREELERAQKEDARREGEERGRTATGSESEEGSPRN